MHGENFSGILAARKNDPPPHPALSPARNQIQTRMKKIPDFTNFEIETVQSTVNERFDREVELQLGDAEVRLNPHTTDMVQCPIMLWKDDGCQFVIIKQGQHSYRPQFFYKVTDEYGTGVSEYVDIADCIIALLQTQADHHSQRVGNFPPE